MSTLYERLTEKQQGNLCWRYLSKNPAAIPILEDNLDKVNWYLLSENKSAIHIL